MCRFVFVEYEDGAETGRVFKLLDGYQLDKNHTFSVSTFGDVFTYADVPAEWSPPAKEVYKERENLRSWLVDASGRDQFVTRLGDETIISWNTKEEPEHSYRRPVR
jgi:translation initiation factor 3 subunit B